MIFDELFRTAMTQGEQPSKAMPYPYQVQFANAELLRSRWSEFACQRHTINARAQSVKSRFGS